MTESPLEAAWSEFSYHGGNLGAARRLFPNAPTPWIDLSTGVNPQAYPLPPLASGDWARLPEPEPVAALEAEAARRYGADAGQTIAASGTQAVIQLLARLRPARRVAILGFTYRGHERAWAAAGAKVETVENIADLAAADVAIVVNPNNPDGRLTDRARLAEIHAEIAARGGILVVDEAFMDLNARDDSLAPILPGKSAIVLRSFGKTYGLAGLRLGFAIASQDIAGTLRDGLAPGPSAGRPSQSGALRSPTMRGSNRQGFASRAMRAALIACLSNAVSNPPAERRCFAWPAIRAPLTFSSISCVAGFWSALFRHFQTDCASDSPATPRLGADWKPRCSRARSLAGRSSPRRKKEFGTRVIWGKTPAWEISKECRDGAKVLVCGDQFGDGARLSTCGRPNQVRPRKARGRAGRRRPGSDDAPIMATGWSDANKSAMRRPLGAFAKWRRRFRCRAVRAPSRKLPSAALLRQIRCGLRSFCRRTSAFPARPGWPSTTRTRGPSI